MNAAQLVEKLLVTASTEQGSFLESHQTQLSDPVFADVVALGLKQSVDRTLRQSATNAQHLNKLIFQLATLTDNRRYEALALRAAGNVAMHGANDYQAALMEYEKAGTIYLAQDDLPEWAQSQIGTVISLGYLGKWDEARALGEEIRPILQQNQAWQPLYGLLMNLSVLHSRRGQMPAALSYLDHAQTMIQQYELTYFEGDLALNRTLMLRNIGRLDEAAAAAEVARNAFERDEQPVFRAHAEMNHALVLIAQSRYNEALTLLDKARETYIATECITDAVWLDLFATKCWLQLGRYQQVLQLTAGARRQFGELGLPSDLAATILSEGVALTALNRFTEARAAFLEAQRLFEADKNPGEAALGQLEFAAALLRHGDYAEAKQVATTTYAKLIAFQQPLATVRAQLIAAEADFHAGEVAAALVLLDQAESVAREQKALWLLYQAQWLRGRVLVDSAETEAAFGYLDQAINTLERLRGSLMTEFRADFLSDKEGVYSDMVRLCITMEQPAKALEYVERARSRALIDLIANRLDLSIVSRSSDDSVLVDQLLQLQAQHNMLYRRWMDGDCVDTAVTQRELQLLEQQVTQLWHRLMVRNADYARDAAMTTVRSEPIQPYLAADTLLLDYFVMGDEVIVFLVSAETISLVRLPNIMRRVAKLLRQFNLNLKAVSLAPPERILRQIPAAQRLLQQLYQLLFAPMLAELSAFQKLIVVPHKAALHYLPFHALFDGKQYVCERFEVSYLPSASLLHYRQGRDAATLTGSSSNSESVTQQAENSLIRTAAVIGYSNGGALPFAVEEATRIAQQINGRAVVEEAATIEAVQSLGQQATILHLSTHGDFNQDNPLFSGLSLANGQLSTLDIFNLRLRASLVTLSACQTGRSVVKGGDELQGLARAFLYAGSSALLVSLWQVHDRSTLHWMEYFYAALVDEQQTKSAAVQVAQRAFIMAEGVEQHLAHPWFWAPFFLIGDTGALS